MGTENRIFQTGQRCYTVNAAEGPISGGKKPNFCKDLISTKRTVVNIFGFIKRLYAPVMGACPNMSGGCGIMLPAGRVQWAKQFLWVSKWVILWCFLFCFINMCHDVSSNVSHL